jgi:hypothetical protein
MLPKPPLGTLRNPTQNGVGIPVAARLSCQGIAKRKTPLGFLRAYRRFSNGFVPVVVVAMLMTMPALAKSRKTKRLADFATRWRNLL